MFKQRVWALALFAVSLPAAAAPADAAYQSARKSYRALKADPARRKFRHQWINAAHRFELVAANYPHSRRAPAALFDAAQLLRELSQISGAEEDLDSAIADYQRLIASYPRDGLSDDSALALGRVYFERRRQPELARRVLSRALARHPRGPRAGDLKLLLSALPPESAKVARAAEDRPANSARRAKSEATADPPPRTRALLDAIARASSANPTAPEGARETSLMVAAPSAAREEFEPAHPVSEASEKSAPPPIVPEKSAPPPIIPEKSASPPIVPEKSASAPIIPERARAIAHRPGSGDATLSEQLGLKVHRVVIDPGHGGHDTGAVGARGAREKDVALEISRRLKDLLSASGLEVILTREDDAFVALEDRAKFANDAKGDLFISIHCNSATDKKLRGIETYTLNTSSDRYSIRLAARENASSERGISDLQYILADLATKANTEESTRLAAKVQQSLVTHLRSKHRGVLDLGTKEALFYVLLGARMPAILVEASFLSNAEEEKRLSSNAYRQDIAAAIAAGIGEFLGTRQRVAKVN